VPHADFEAHPTEIEGLTVITVKQISDDRGTVRELFRASTYAGAAPEMPHRLVQINLTSTRRGAIRGLHGEAMTKLVAVVAGEALGAYVDARPDSATFGTVVTVPLKLGIQVLVPNGVLNGFQATGETGCEYLYGFDVEWEPGMPGTGANALDPDLAIPWPVPVDPDDRALMSAKDAGLPPFSQHAGA
jgi:dTDP-4-dehydrorhamnose 3,5-epimerase